MFPFFTLPTPNNLTYSAMGELSDHHYQGRLVELARSDRNTFEVATRKSPQEGDFHFHPCGDETKKHRYLSTTTSDSKS